METEHAGTVSLIWPVVDSWDDTLTQQQAATGSGADAHHQPGM